MIITTHFKPLFATRGAKTVGVKCNTPGVRFAWQQMLQDFRRGEGVAGLTFVPMNVTAANIAPREREALYHATQLHRHSDYRACVMTGAFKK